MNMSQTVERKQILATTFTKRGIDSVDVREIRLEPNQQSGRHLHPCTVVGYIVSGTAVFQIEGEEQLILPSGSAFCELADAVIANFGNASSTEPITFVAFYLKDGEQDLIRMLDPKSS
jgi:quercetin dioxygenase-like cupin family protein